MTAITSVEQFHQVVLRESFIQRLDDASVMLLFCLLHSYEIEVHPGVLHPNSSVTVPAITQRHAGEVVASLFQGRRKKPDDYRADPSHWYWLWNTKWGSYSHAENLSDEESTELSRLRTQLEQHAWIAEIREQA